MEPGSRKILWLVGAVFAVIFLAGVGNGFLKYRDPAEIRKRAITAGLPACVKTAKSTLAQQGKTVGDATIDSYCDCAVKQSLAALSDEQVKQRDLSLPQALGPRYQQIMSTCAAQALGR